MTSLYIFVFVLAFVILNASFFLVFIPFPPTTPALLCSRPCIFQHQSDPLSAFVLLCERRQPLLFSFYMISSVSLIILVAFHFIHSHCCSSFSYMADQNFTGIPGEVLAMPHIITLLFFIYEGNTYTSCTCLFLGLIILIL